MTSSLLLASTSILFLCIIFVIAWLGDHRSKLAKAHKTRAAIYSLSLAVYCTSWSYYGAVGMSVNTGIGFLPVYLGPMLALLLGAPLIAHLVRIGKRHNTTSIADFIANRYGKSQSLAVIVTVISTIAILPYIALQLKALTVGFATLTSEPNQTATSSVAVLLDPAWYLCITMGLFCVLFGVRQIDTTEHHRGMIHAIAFQSIVKLLAFVIVGLFSVFLLIEDQNFTPVHLSEGLLENFLQQGDFSALDFTIFTLLGFLAVFCLPRQFHVTIVENHKARDVYTARWAFPAYLLIMAAFVLPIALAGSEFLPPGAHNPDTYILNLPQAMAPQWLTVITFIGGAAAATAMIIVSTVTLSTMLTNEILAPLLMRVRTLNLSHRRNVKLWLLNTRRTTVFVTLLASFCLYRFTGSEIALSSAGLLSFAAIAQCAPAMLGGLVWRRGNRNGAVTGMLTGFGLWTYTILVPTIIQLTGTNTALLDDGPLGIMWLRPTALFGLEGLGIITHGTIVSLAFNISLYWLISALTTQRVVEKIQLASFLDRSHKLRTASDEWVEETTIGDVSALADRFLGKKAAAEIFQGFLQHHQIDLHPKKIASPELIRHLETKLASAIGASTARAVLNSALKGKQMQIEDVVSIVDEASQVIKFNRELLQAAIENMSLGVSVVDNNLKLVAWNSRYVEIFNYPQGFLRMGRPMADLLRYNLLMNNVPAHRAQQIAEARLDLMLKGESHDYERMRPDGTVILVQGSPMPDGGFVTTFSDISAMRRTELALKETNTYLEERVRERTEELSILNEQLATAKSAAENANQSKTRFLAAASHDILQPLNAARLFTSALSNKLNEFAEQRDLLEHIDTSLSAAEEILSTLLDISKLDAGAYEPHYSVFNIEELLRNLNTEFSVIAQDHNLELRTVFCKAMVCSDHQMLRRVIQNLISNAIRYTNQGRVLLGCRKRHGKLRIEVWDTGPGIPKAQLKSIFEEFKRLNQGEAEKSGLGLGLAIVDRICNMLNYQIEVRSTPGRGSVFAVILPMLDTPDEDITPIEKPTRSVVSLVGAEVFCIDNEPAILEGMRALLEGWGCKVHAGATPEQAETICNEHPPEIILADYQLDDGKNGLDTMDKLRQQLDREIPGILVTALTTEEVKEDARSRNYQILHKPLKPAALRAMINKMLSKS